MGFYRDNGKENGNYYIYIYIYIEGLLMEKKMETSIYIYIYIYGLCRVYVKIPDLSSPRGLIF